MDVPQIHHKHFVARRGAVLRELAEEYGGVIVSFPRQGQNSTAVKIKGAKNCVEGAKKRIEEIVQDLVSIVLLYRFKYERLLIGQCDSKLFNIAGKSSYYRMHHT